MSEETLAAADDLVTGADAPATTSPEQHEDTHSPDSEAPPEQEPEPPEEIEFDFGGSKLRVPKGSIPEDIATRLTEFTKGTWADYTRKSQDAAAQVKVIEARAAHVERLTSMSEAMQEAYADGKAVRKELERLSAVNLDALWQSDPDQARRVSDHKAQKEREFHAAVSRVAQFEEGLTTAKAQAAEQERQQAARLIEDGKRTVAKAIPNLNEAELIAYAVKALKVTPEAAQAYGATPEMAVVAWKAMQYDRMQQRAAPSTTPAPAPPPIAPMKARPAAAAKNPDDMSADEWLRWRNSQLAKAGRR